MTDRDPVEFIRARLDEDEQAALAWRDDRRSWQVVGRRNVQYRSGGSDGYVAVDVTGRIGDWWEQIRVMCDLGGLADHIALHDPSRVLREVGAKRKVLAEHRPMEERMSWGEYWTVCGRCRYDQGLDVFTYPCPTVRALVGIWPDHPDYDPSWTVE